MQGWCRWPGLVWHKRVVCRVPQFPQLIPGLSALSGQHDPSSYVISFILYPAFCTYQQYIALHYHYIGTYYYINITSIQSRSFCIIFIFSMHQQGNQAAGCDSQAHTFLKMSLSVVQLVAWSHEQPVIAQWATMSSQARWRYQARSHLEHIFW